MPIFVKMGASRVFDDVRLAAKAGADVIVVDGMEGGTGATPELLQEHTGIPTLAAVCEARAALEDIGLYGTVQLVIAGGLRHGSDCAKALALGADACYLGTALLIALTAISRSMSKITTRSGRHLMRATTAIQGAVRWGSRRKTRSCRPGWISKREQSGSPTFSMR